MKWVYDTGTLVNVKFLVNGVLFADGQNGDGGFEAKFHEGINLLHRLILHYHLFIYYEYLPRDSPSSILINCYQWGSCFPCKTLNKGAYEIISNFPCETLNKGAYEIISNFHHQRLHRGIKFGKFRF